MFKIVKEQNFKTPVTVLTPVDGGGHREETLTATFRLLPTSQVDHFERTTLEGNKSWLRAVIVELDDLADDKGNPIVFNAAVLDAVLDLPNARTALASKYAESVTKVKAGN